MSRPGSANSVSGHTGAGVPLLFRDMLNEIAPIDEDAVDSYGAREAVEKLQSRCKWDQGAFGEPTCLRVPFESKEPDFGDASVDIVIPSIRDLTFLEVCHGSSLGYL